jgi:hypothetical protein
MWPTVLLRAAAIVVLLAAGSDAASAFQNIEADAIYDRAIREQIRKEYTQRMEALKAQAEQAGMPVRDRDVQSLQRYMYDKALVMGQCVDKALTARKTIAGDALLDKEVAACIELHVKFIDWLRASPGTNLLGICGLKTRKSRGINPPYDFLGIRGEEALQVTDLLAMRDCYKVCLEKGENAPDCPVSVYRY